MRRSILLAIVVEFLSAYNGLIGKPESKLRFVKQSVFTRIKSKWDLKYLYDGVELINQIRVETSNL